MCPKSEEKNHVNRAPKMDLLLMCPQGHCCLAMHHSDYA